MNRMFSNISRQFWMLKLANVRSNLWPRIQFSKHPKLDYWTRIASFSKYQAREQHWVVAQRRHSQLTKSRDDTAPAHLQSLQSLPVSLTLRLRILFLCDAFNSMTQRLYLECTQLGHEVHLHIANGGGDKMAEQVAIFRPDIVICPFLTARVPAEIWRDAAVPCLIVHPGVEGDRGVHALDWALLRGEPQWGVTVLQAAQEMDAGDVWATRTFPVRRALDGGPPTKSGLYRGECVTAAVAAVKQALQMYISGQAPHPLNYSDPAVRGRLHPRLRGCDRQVDWAGKMEDITAKIRASDTQPGTPEIIAGERYYLYGAHMEKTMSVENKPPKTLIGQRDGAILISCGNGAVWVSHLKKRSRHGEKKSFKLPATMALPESVMSALPEIPSPELAINFGEFPRTFQEIFYWEQGGVCYLWFACYNGALSTAQCRRLCAAWDLVLTRCEAPVIVLMGGPGYFSNGINLNTIEGAADPAQESWQNITAMDDFVKRILTCSTKLTVSAFQGNAGAGGVMLGLAADHVWAHEGVVLSPSYRAMQLYGSEYWTHTLPKRCGVKNALKLTQNTGPVSASQGLALGLVDQVLCAEKDRFLARVIEESQLLAALPELGRVIAGKAAGRGPGFQRDIAMCREAELAEMRKCFESQQYHAARRAFIHRDV